MDTQTILWLVLVGTVATVLTLDLLVFNRTAHAPTFREAAIFSAFYVGLGLLFGVLDLRHPGRGGRVRLPRRATCSN